MPDENRGRSIFGNAWENIIRLSRRSRGNIEEDQRTLGIDQANNISPEMLERWREWRGHTEEVMWRGSTIHDDRVARFNQIGEESNTLEMPRPIFNANSLPIFRDGGFIREGEHTEWVMDDASGRVVPRRMETTLADLEAELNADIEVGHDVNMPSSYTSWTDTNSTTSWDTGSSTGVYYSVAEPIEGITRRCSGCHKSITAITKTRKLMWGMYLCEKCNKEYTYLIKILWKMKGNWNNIHYLFDYAVFLAKKTYKRVKLRDGKTHGCFICGQLRKDAIAYKIENRHRHVYVCRCCEPYIQYMMKSIYNDRLRMKMKRLTNMLKNQDEHIKIRKELEKAKVYK